MQTKFTLAQLARPEIAEADAILRACVHCGFCTATCPTYVLLGDELDSPRGRIYLMKEMLENDRPAGPVETLHLDRCLSCYSCMTTCPSGVDYKHLLDIGRERIQLSGQRALTVKWLRAALHRVLTSPGLFAAALWIAGIARRLGVRALLPKELRAMLDLAPEKTANADRPSPQVLATTKPRARVALLSGCVQDAIDPEINAATKRLFARMGVEIVASTGRKCCGALGHHMGLGEAARDFAKTLIADWVAIADRGGLDAIVVTASGCGTTVKDYGHMFKGDPDWAEKAKRVAELASDVGEFLAKLGLPPRSAQAPDRLRVAYHAACSLQHGQQVRQEPLLLLKQAGFEPLDVPEGHLCCGSAGTYNMLQPDLSRALRDRKANNINSLKADLVVTSNLGCIQQLTGSVSAPIVHIAQALDWASGGPKPSKIERN